MEIEKKFLIKKLPKNLKKGSHPGVAGAPGTIPLFPH